MPVVIQPSPGSGAVTVSPAPGGGSVTVPDAGAGIWGQITGTLSEQTDLQNALDAKQVAGSYAASSHGHVIADVTGLQTALDGKQASGSYAASAHTHAIGDVTGLQTALDGSNAWTLVDQAGAPTTGQSWAWSTNIANVDVTGLANYNELLVIARQMTASLSGTRAIQLSTNNGSTFFSGATDYTDISTAGTETNASGLFFTHGSATTLSRSIAGHIINLDGPETMVIPSGGVIRRFAGSTSAVNAIRLTNSAGGNLTSGTLWVFAR